MKPPHRHSGSGSGSRPPHGQPPRRAGEQHGGQHGAPNRGEGRERPRPPGGGTRKEGFRADRSGHERRPEAPRGVRLQAAPAAPAHVATERTLHPRLTAGLSAPAPRVHPESPRGTVWLYGLHAVTAALANPARRLRRLLLTEEAEAALAARRPPPWPIPTETVDRSRLDHLLGRDVVHQGAALLADLLAVPPLAHVLERPGPLLVLDQVSDPRNVGAILRSAQAFGAAAVIVQERNAPDETGALAKAASGALETVPLLRAVNLARTLVALKAAGCWVVGLDSASRPLTGGSFDGRRVVLVLGAEGEGLRRLTRESCDEVAGIAMPGAGRGLDSLNVAAAAAIALYELGRPRAPMAR